MYVDGEALDFKAFISESKLYITIIQETRCQITILQFDPIRIKGFSIVNKDCAV